MKPTLQIGKNKTDKYTIDFKKESKWVWETSKKVVTACALSYFCVIIFVCIVSLKLMTVEYFNTLIQSSADILERCVYGYFIKAGTENIFKGITAKIAEIYKLKYNINNDSDTNGVG